MRRQHYALPHWSAGTEDDVFDAHQAHDVFDLDDPTGELATATRLRLWFGRAGYGRVRVRKPSLHHPVWLVKAVKHTGPRFTSDSDLLRHVIPILQGAGFRASRKDVIAQQSGDGITVSLFDPNGSKEARIENVYEFI